MWPAQEGGAIYCKWLSDAIQLPLSKTEFIQEALVTSKKMPSLWMYTHQTTRLETRDEQAWPTENTSTNGKERSWLPDIQQCYFWGWPLRQERRTDTLPLFHKSRAGRFLLCLLVKALPENGFRTRNPGIISNLATVTIKEISATEQKEEYCNLKSET